jgi:hypothetical protein
MIGIDPDSEERSLHFGGFERKLGMSELSPSAHGLEIEYKQGGASHSCAQRDEARCCCMSPETTSPGDALDARPATARISTG